MYRVFISLALVFYSSVAWAADPPSWTPRQMLEVKRVGGVYPSPPIAIGNLIAYRVAYTVREAVMDDSRSEFVTQIYVCDSTGLNHFQLTRGAHSSDGPQW